MKFKPDEKIFEACIQEQRCLLTLDLDFSDVLRFPPHKSAGIAVFRPPKGVSRRFLEAMVSSFLAITANEPIVGRLWIIESNRIRVHEKTDPNSN
jgi:predicted nuclease of predicted toxin-antitoxin system